jgi:hypothetical protein
MIVNRRSFLAMASSIGVVAMAGCAGEARPVAEDRPRRSGLWDRWVPGSKRAVDHGPLAALLDRHILKRSDGVHLFAYGDLTVAERGSLDRYIHELAGFAIDSLDRREQFAFWLNLYNALVLRLILSRYLVLSIRDIDFGVGPFGDGPFERKLVAVLGQPLGLSDIRNGILWPIFNDPRLHYGLCDAAIGSPNLQPRVFTGERVDRMLDGAALDYVNHPRGARREGRRLVLSQLYEWHGNDFGGAPAGVLAHLRQYAGPGLAPELTTETPVRFDFDWSLNDGTGLRK